MENNDYDRTADSIIYLKVSSFDAIYSQISKAQRNLVLYHTATGRE
jgi:hypothetical protein